MLRIDQSRNLPRFDGLTTKMVALVDALGEAIAVRAVGGTPRRVASDARRTVQSVVQALMADRGFRSNSRRRCWRHWGETLVPPESNRKEAIDCDMEKYRRRPRVANFLCRIKHFRYIAMRYDQTESP